MAIFRVISRFSGYFNLWRLSPKISLTRFLGHQKGVTPICSDLFRFPRFLPTCSDLRSLCSDFLFPLQPLTPPLPRQPPRPSHPQKLDFGPFWLRLAPFRVCFGSVSGPFWGVGWGQVGVGERGFCKGKEYHYPCVLEYLDLFRLTLISSDFFRTNQNKSGKFLSADPLCKSPTNQYGRSALPMQNRTL